MASVRELSQQERRVYVGNLSYDVKWRHLKDFIRQGKQSFIHLFTLLRDLALKLLIEYCSGGGAFCRCAIASKWNVEGGLFVKSHALY